jgi:methylmalonyl-CoA mutase
VEAAEKGASLSDLAMASIAPGPACAPLPSLRDGAPFETLRDEADKRAKRPTVFLANLGPVAAFTARATFAKNFFETGGIAALSNDGFADEAALVAAFKSSGAKLACLCSSDAIYAERAAAAAHALRSAGADVAFAGRPGDLEAALKEAGVSSFIFAGCDLLATLKEALAKA